MFCDYYSVLCVEETATIEQIKLAFKKQAIKWHPDKNPGIDTTIQMQQINEAYLILRDIEARARYDEEYKRFKRQKYSEKEQSNSNAQGQSYGERENKETQKSSYEEYVVNDDILKKWMNNAKKQAVELAKQSIEDLTGMASAGADAAIKEAGSQILYRAFFSLIAIIAIAIVKSCNG